MQAGVLGRVHAIETSSCMHMHLGSLQHPQLYTRMDSISIEATKCSQILIFRRIQIQTRFFIYTVDPPLLWFGKLNMCWAIELCKMLKLANLHLFMLELRSYLVDLCCGGTQFLLQRMQFSTHISIVFLNTRIIVMTYKPGKGKHKNITAATNENTTVSFTSIYYRAQNQKQVGECRR